MTPSSPLPHGPPTRTSRRSDYSSSSSTAPFSAQASLLGHSRAGLHQRVEEEYEQDEYDDYEEAEASEDEDEGEEEHEDPEPTKEELDFLKVREQLKEKFRQKLKKQSASTFGRSSLSQASKTVANDKFGSFFGPSKPVIAARVLEESRSMRETQHVVAKIPNSSTSSKKGPVSTSTETKTSAHHQRPQLNARDQRRQKVQEVKNKAKTLKDARDYSFLFSDDPDPPAALKEEPAPRKVPIPNSANNARPAAMKARPVQRPAQQPVQRPAQPPVRPPVRPPVPRPVPQQVLVRNSDGQSAEGALKGKVPARLVSKDQGRNSASASQHMRPKLGSKEPSMHTSKPASVEVRKGIGTSARKESGRLVGREALPQKDSAQRNVSMRPPAKIVNGTSGSSRPVPVKPSSSNHNHQSENRRVTQGQDKLKATPKQPLPSSKNQPMKSSKPLPARGIHEERSRKRPLRRDPFEEEEDDGAIQLIRNMFGYNPNKYKNMDEDDSDMEADFDSIMAEEARSLRIAKKEDEEQLRLIEEEERRERMRKKQKMSGRR